MELNYENTTNKKQTKPIYKVLILLIICVLVIICIIFALLQSLKENRFFAIVDEKEVDISSAIELIKKVDDVTYINIKEYAKLAGYEYHDGEYKGFSLDKSKCYVQKGNETASFYIDENKLYKLPVNQLTSDYKEYSFKNQTKQMDGIVYAPIEMINVAFNTITKVNEKNISIYTLNYIVNSYNQKAVNWGYEKITDYNFENKKAILYGFLIVRKENGLYKVINLDNTKEIMSDKYNKIQFEENTQEFFVTNSLGKVGIINSDGTTKIEPIYDSIECIDKEADIYVVQIDNKYGMVREDNKVIAKAEFDEIGITTKESSENVGKQYLLLGSLVPVKKDNKWGAYDKEGKIVLKLEYDGFGCNVDTVKISEASKKVCPVLTIEKCQGIVVQKDKKYGLFDTNGTELVTISVDSIYGDGQGNYLMTYNGKELNVIDELVKAGIIKEDVEGKNEVSNNSTVHNTTNNIQNNSVITVDM